MLAKKYQDSVIIRTFTDNGKEYARIKTTCSRCDGTGYYCGGTCFKCNGNMFFVKNVRNYTEAEYNQLLAQEAKRQAKRQAKRNEEAARRIKEHNIKLLNKCGFIDVYAYAVVGDTYRIKEELKQHGAKFTPELHWVCPEEPIWLDTTQYVKINVEDVFELNQECLSIKDTAPEFIRSLQPVYGAYLGSIGERITVHVTVTKVIVSTEEYMVGWPTDVYTYIMSTDSGERVMWKTSAVEWPEGYRCSIRGTIKRLSDYNNVRTTVLTRCKEVT